VPRLFNASNESGSFAGKEGLTDIQKIGGSSKKMEVGAVTPLFESCKALGSFDYVQVSTGYNSCTNPVLD